MEKYSYIDSGIKWLGDIPEHWNIDRLKDKFFSVVGGDWGNDIDSDEDGIDITVLRVADLDGMYFSFENKTIRKIKKGSYHSRKITDRSLIIEKSGGGEKQLVGRVGFAKDLNFDAICSNFMANMTLDNSVDLNFINYLFTTLYSSKLNFPFVQQTTGIQNLNVTYYLTTKVAFPPIQEQKAIAEYLDKTTAKLDTIIAIKQKQLLKIEELRLSIFFQACTQGLNSEVEFIEVNNGHITKMPSNWRYQRIKRGCKNIDTGKTPSSSEPEYFIDGTIEWFAPECFNEGLVINKPKKLINKKAIEDNQIKIYPRNSVFYVGVGATAGKVGIIQKPSSCNQQINILETNFKLLPEFLAYQMKIIEKEIIKFAQYTTLPILNQAKTGYLQIAFPPINEQKEIIKFLDDFTKKLNKTKASINSQIKTLKAYRKSLIHECITGKKQVTSVIKNEIYA
jgi:type I restriction enzyme, S subunit